MIKLTLSEQMVELIGAALAELPYKMSAGAIHEIQRQVADQEQESEPQRKNTKRSRLDPAN